MPASPLSQKKVKIEGTELTDQQATDLLEVVVDTALFMPGMFTLVFEDHDLSYCAGTLLKPGKKVDVMVKVGDDGSDVKLITGKITAIEPEYLPDGNVLVRARGYDDSFKLTQGKHTVTYAEAKDSDVVSKIAQKAGLTAATDSTTAKYPVLIQYNQTYWEFIVSRARRLGMLVYFADGKLNFKKPAASDSGVELEWKVNLFHFEPRVSLAGQLSKATGMGWDSATKKAVTDSQTASSGGKTFRAVGFAKDGVATIKEYASEAEGMSVAHPAPTVDEAKGFSTARIMEAESKFIQAEGESYISPGIAAGKQVKIKGVGSQFEGKYTVTHVRHTLNQDGAFTWFNASGFSPENLCNLLLPDETLFYQPVHGVVIGVVTDNNDKDKIGRVKVKYPWLPKVDGAEISSDWVRVAADGGGSSRGVVFAPEVDDEVLVSFEHGDINFPFIVGGLWNKKDKLPTTVKIKDGKVNTRVIQSRSGHYILLDDTDGKEKITIIDKSGKNSIEIDSSKNSITMKADGDLTFEAKGKINITSKTDKITIDGKNGLALSSAMNVNIAGGNGQSKVDLKPDGAALQGLKVDLQAQTMASVKGSAMVQIQGGIVKIN